MSAAAPSLRALLLAAAFFLFRPTLMLAAGVDPYKLEEIQTLKSE